jgi:putative flippase GtrA
MDRNTGQGCRMPSNIRTEWAKKSKSIFKLFSRKTAVQLGRYFVTGMLAAGLEYSLLILFTEYVGLWYILSNSIAYISGFAVSFLLNRYWSFQSKENILKQFLQYAMLFTVNFVLNNILMYVLTSIAGIPYTISKLFVMGMVVTWNFVIFKKIIYKK